MERLVDFFLNLYGPVPYLVLLLLLLACGIGFPLPEDIILFAGAIISYYGVSNLWVMLGVAFFGILIGDSIIFFLGAHYGRKLTKKWFFRKIMTEERLETVREKLHRRGNKLIFAARFMPGLRAPVYFSAGTLHLPFRVFIFYDGLAALLSVPAIMITLYYFGDQVDTVVRKIQRVEHGIVFVILGFVALIGIKWWLTHRKEAQQVHHG